MMWWVGAIPCRRMHLLPMHCGMATGHASSTRPRVRRRAALIPRIEASIAAYPYHAPGTYSVWPGPNSNTFVAWVVRHTEGLNAELPPVAVGKDWLGNGIGLATAPSHSGYTVSLFGVIGATLAIEEGVELHLLGSTIGLDVNDLAIKLPALGKFTLLGNRG